MKPGDVVFAVVQDPDKGFETNKFIVVQSKVMLVIKDDVIRVEFEYNGETLNRFSFATGSTEKEAEKKRNRVSNQFK